MTVGPVLPFVIVPPQAAPWQTAKDGDVRQVGKRQEFYWRGRWRPL